jgi:hypothetical protein
MSHTHYTHVCRTHSTHTLHIHTHGTRVSESEVLGKATKLATKAWLPNCRQLLLPSQALGKATTLAPPTAHALFIWVSCTHRAHFVPLSSTLCPRAFSLPSPSLSHVCVGVCVCVCVRARSLSFALSLSLSLLERQTRDAEEDEAHDAEDTARDPYVERYLSTHPPTQPHTNYVSAPVLTLPTHKHTHTQQHTWKEGGTRKTCKQRYMHACKCTLTLARTHMHAQHARTTCWQLAHIRLQPRTGARAHTQASSHARSVRTHT